MKQLLLFPLLFFCILMAGCEKDKDTFSAVYDVPNYGIDKIEKSLTVSELNVAIKQNISAVVENWCVAYVVPISFDITNVRLVINYK